MNTGDIGDGNLWISESYETVSRGGIVAKMVVF